jgi:endonuclease/exonuclease/phosphatase family metal-dependent hydrolase
LRVITWNLHGSAKPRLDAVVELLQAHDPDVVVLQEARRHQARLIAALMRWRKPVWAFKHNGYWPLWWRAEGLAVASRYALAGHPPVVLTEGVSRRSFRRRIVLPVEVVLEGDHRVLLVDAHLASEASDEGGRVAQAERVVGLLPGTVPEVVAGDLNSVPGSPPITTILAAGFADAWAEAGAPGDPGDTLPANAPRKRIDYVMVRGGRAVTAEVIADLGPAMAGLSDHRPVLAALDLADEPPEPPEAPQQ